MAKKGKDLFVLLGERLNPSSQGRRQAAAKGAGGWFRSLFGAVPDSGAQKPGGSRGKGPATGRKTPPRVPRGLLVPGWFVILLLLMGVSAGFVAGRWSSDRPGDPLNVKIPKKSGMVPVSFPDGRRDAEPQDPRNEPGYLPLQKQEERLSINFFLMLDYPAPQRDRAEALARYLRGQGLEKTRIRKVTTKDGSARWLTLCYVDDTADGQYSTAHAKDCFARLKRVPPPKFEPRLADVVGRLKSAHDLYR